MNKKAPGAPVKEVPKEEMFTKAQVDELMKVATNTAVESALKKVEEDKNTYKPAPIVDHLPKIKAGVPIRVRAKEFLYCNRYRRSPGEKFKLQDKMGFNPELMEFIEVVKPAEEVKAAPLI